MAEVLSIHADQIGRYGGAAGVRDQGLLHSAVAQPRAGSGGEYFHQTVFEMASAYAFHLVRNHPFVDGNKRVALAASLVFLELNDVMILDPKGQLHRAIVEVAAGKLSKSDFSALLKTLAKTHSK